MKNILIQITNNGMGAGNEELGLTLISNYLNLIYNEDKLPRFIALYNSGVKLICTGSPCIEILKKIEAKGVKLIACKTCLNYFGLIEQTEVGIQGTMMDILELQIATEKVITL